MNAEDVYMQMPKLHNRYSFINIKKKSFMWLLCLMAAAVQAQQPVPALNGSVRSAKTGSPVIGATLQIRGAALKDTVTGAISDEDGVYSFMKLADGNYTLELPQSDIRQSPGKLPFRVGGLSGSISR